MAYRWGARQRVAGGGCLWRWGQNPDPHTYPDSHFHRHADSYACTDGYTYAYIDTVIHSNAYRHSNSCLYLSTYPYPVDPFSGDSLRNLPGGPGRPSHPGGQDSPRG
ncbi:MAG: hypothetical protein KJ624_06495 [Chloroflexi bacterium]|nr:hypothetical protein [Chloroflexota bacterium]